MQTDRQKTKLKKKTHTHIYIYKYFSEMSNLKSQNFKLYTSQTLQPGMAWGMVYGTMIVYPG